MPSESQAVPAQAEKPHHYTWVHCLFLSKSNHECFCYPLRLLFMIVCPALCRYLKEFRTQQCPLFLQHKCTQHRPYTCFHWHFMNQRRRRPIRKKDGTYNYSPDVYCTKYDETTGICPDGDEWVLLNFGGSMVLHTGTWLQYTYANVLQNAQLLIRLEYMTCNVLLWSHWGCIRQLSCPMWFHLLILRGFGLTDL